MATIALEGAVMQHGLELGLKGIRNAGAFVYRGLSGSDCKKLEQIVNSLSPIVKDLCESRSESLPNSSLQKFPKFQEKIAEGNQLVEEYKKSRNPVRKFQIDQRIKKVDKSINKFIQNDLQIVMVDVQVYLSSLQKDMLNLQVSLSAELVSMRDGVEAMRRGMEALLEAFVSSLQKDMLNLQVSLSADLVSVRDGVEAMRGGMKNVSGQVESVGEAVEIVRDGVETGVQSLHEAVDTVHQELKNLICKFEEQQSERSQQGDSLCGTPDPPTGFLGFDQHILNLKKFLLEDGFNVVGVTAMGGARKSTLAKAVCKNDKIKGYSTPIEKKVS